MTQDGGLGLRALVNFLAHRLAAADAILGRRRTEPERGCDPGQDLVVLMAVAGPPCMRGRALPGFGRRFGPSLVPMQPRLEPPCAAEAEIVAAALEDPHRPGHRPRGVLHPALLDVEEAEELLLDEHMRVRALVAAAAASRSASPSTRPASVSRPHPISAPPISASSAVRRGSSGTSSRETRSSRPIAAGRSLRTSARRPAASSRSHARAASDGRVRVARPECNAIPERLLEMVADDLLELAQPVLGRPLEPGGVALVQVGARVLRQRAVGGVADQGMAEAVGLLAGEVCTLGRIRSRRTSASRAGSSAMSGAWQARSATAPR